MVKGVQATDVCLYISVFNHPGIRTQTTSCPEKRYCVKARGVSEELKTTNKSFGYWIHYLQ